MKQEDVDLLLKDLCSRLPYEVKVQTGLRHNYETGETFPGIETMKPIMISIMFEDWIEEYKPYLFPLSSMTEEQLYEFSQILGKDCDISGGFIEIINSCRKTFSYQEIDALFQLMNKYHFDYRGLIPKGLAIDATELNLYK